MTMKQTGLNAANTNARRSESIAAANAALEAETADTRSIEATAAALDVARTDTGRIDAADSTVEAASLADPTVS